MKLLFLLVAMATLLFFAACGEELPHGGTSAPVDELPQVPIPVQAQDAPTVTLDPSLLADSHEPLIFNVLTPRPIMSAHPPWTIALSLELSEEQIQTAFPYIEYPLAATAHYGGDGSLYDVGVHIVRPDDDWWRHAGFWISAPQGLGLFGTSLRDYAFDIDNNFARVVNWEESMVHGIPVTALMVIEDRPGMMRLQADFRIGRMDFRVGVSEETAQKEAGMALLTELVNQLILGGADGFTALEKSAEEFRFGELSLEEAHLDPKFGAYMPANIPERFYFERAERRKQQFNDYMTVEWSTPLWDQEQFNVLLETNPWASTEWEAKRRFIRWEISHIEDIDWIRTDLVSANEPERYDWSLYPIVRIDGSHYRYHDVPMDFRFWPIFLSEEFSYEIVEARGWERASIYLVEEGDDSMLETEFTEYVLHTNFEFGVLFGDILIRIRTVGATSEEIWALFAELRPVG